jgi:hypothetical protein
MTVCCHLEYLVKIQRKVHDGDVTSMGKQAKRKRQTTPVWTQKAQKGNEGTEGLPHVCCVQMDVLPVKSRSKRAWGQIVEEGEAKACRLLMWGTPLPNSTSTTCSHAHSMTTHDRHSDLATAQTQHVGTICVQHQTFCAQTAQR